jgi:hypothetical protein
MSATFIGVADRHQPFPGIAALQPGVHPLLSLQKHYLEPFLIETSTCSTRPFNAAPSREQPDPSRALDVSEAAMARLRSPFDTTLAACSAGRPRSAR